EPARAQERRAGELEQDPLERRRFDARSGLLRLGNAHPPSAKRSNSSTSTPWSASACPTVLVVSWIQGCSVSTWAAKKRLFSIPSTIFSRACSGFESTSSEFA